METLNRTVALGLLVAVATALAGCREADTNSTPRVEIPNESQVVSGDSSLSQQPSIATSSEAATGEPIGPKTDGPRWAPGEEWRLSQQPLAKIGELDGPEAIGSVGATLEQFPSGVALLSEGRIAIADGLANEIRVYDASGKRLFAMGRAGAGPGEFRGLRGIKSFGRDFLLAWDTYTGTFVGRLSVFTAEGAFVRNVPTETWFSSLVGVSDAGTVLVQPRPTPAGWTRPYEGQYREPRLYERISATGTSLGPLGPVLGREWVEFGGGQRSLVFFGPDTEIAVGKNAIYVGDSDEFTIAVHDPETGVTVRTVTRPYEPWRVTSEELTEHREYWDDSKRRSEAFYAQRGAAPRFIADAKDIPARQTWPVFVRLIEDSDENLWVAHMQSLSDSAQTWSVFNREGAWFGEVLIPNSMNVQAVSGDRIAVITRDKFRVQYVLVYGLLK